MRVEILPAWARDPFHVACAELALPRPGLAEVRHTTAGREIRVLRAHRHPDGRAAPYGLRPGGRYLVGGGGLGERLALRLVAELGARVVLFGAGPPAGPEQDDNRLLRVPGRPCQYADARGAVQAARHAFGGLDGVLHCPSGGELRPLARQSTAVARETLADAVSGAAHLDRATAALPLDFFALVTDAAPYQAPAGRLGARRRRPRAPLDRRDPGPAGRGRLPATAPRSPSAATRRHRPPRGARRRAGQRPRRGMRPRAASRLTWHPAVIFPVV